MEASITKQQKSIVIPLNIEKNRLKNVLVVHTKYKIHIIPFEDIYYLKSVGNYCEIHTKERKILSSRTMKYHVNQITSNQFLRVHNSFTINTSKVESINKSFNQLVLKRDITIPYSRSKRKLIINFFTP